MFVPLGHLVTTGVTVSHAQIVKKILCEGEKEFSQSPGEISRYSRLSIKCLTEKCIQSDENYDYWEVSLVSQYNNILTHYFYLLLK